MPDKPHVLIIDDDRAVAMALRVRLEAAGYELDWAPDGRSGIARVTANRPDVILLDIRMPDIDGIEVSHTLKRDPELAAIPIVFLSANAQERAKRQALAAGGACFLEKPFESTVLLATLERVLASREVSP